MLKLPLRGVNKMKNILITGVAGCGKTAIALGLAQLFLDEGLKVAYFKPLGATPSPGRPDKDGILMKEVLKLETPIEKIIPYAGGTNYLLSYTGNFGGEEVKSKILDCYQEISSDADLLLIDGAVFPYAYHSWEMDCASLAEAFNAAVLSIIKIKNSDFVFDAHLMCQEYLRAKGVNILGAIFNQVPLALNAKTEGIYKPLLEGKGVATLGIIPENPLLSSPTVKEYYEVLGGEILTGEEHFDRIVEDVVVGAMTMEGALNILRRKANKAVIIGGDRADLASAAMETDTAVLILTGGLYPDVQVVAQAYKKNIPVILVPYDTYTTIGKLSNISSHINPEDKEVIRMTKENISVYCDWNLIKEKIQQL